MSYTIHKQPEYIMIAHSDARKEKEIDKKIFTELKTKGKILKILWIAENHYASIGQAYKNFEMSLFEISFDYRHCTHQDVHRIGWLGQQKNHVNLMALLNTIYTYTNSLRKSYIKDLKKLTKDTEKFTQRDIDDIENQFTRSRDTRLEYRIMRAFRNFMTHAPYADVRGSFQILSEREKYDVKDSPSRSRSASNPSIVIDIVAKDRKFKQECENDIKRMKQKGYNCFDVKFMLRGHIEEVAKIHNMFREKTESLLSSILTELHTIGREMLPESEIPPVIRIIKLSSENSDGEEYALGHEHQSRLKDKRQEWKNFAHEQKHHYSSAIISESKRYPQEDSRLWITE